MRKEWANVLRVRNEGVPIVGFTWYSLTDQTDWDTALREKNNHVNPVGLYDLNRKIRPVGEAYKTIIREWRDVSANPEHLPGRSRWCRPNKDSGGEGSSTIKACQGHGLSTIALRPQQERTPWRTHDGAAASKDRTVIVTGAASGIGLAIARRFRAVRERSVAGRRSRCRQGFGRRRFPGEGLPALERRGAKPAMSGTRIRSPPAPRPPIDRFGTP